MKRKTTQKIVIETEKRQCIESMPKIAAVTESMIEKNTTNSSKKNYNK